MPFKFYQVFLRLIYNNTYVHWLETKKILKFHGADINGHTKKSFKMYNLSSARIL